MSERILIADDDALIREALERTLERAGYRVDGVASGDAALGKLGHSSYDLLLVDLRLPDMDGLYVLEEARRRDPWCGALIVTGYGSLESAVAAMEAGASGFLLKPVLGEELVEKVAATLARVRSSREQQRLKALEPVRTLSRLALQGGRPRVIAGRLLDTVRGALEASQALLFEGGGREMRLAAARGFPSGASLSEQEVVRHLWGSLRRWDSPLLLVDGSHHADLYERLREQGIGSLLGVPLADSLGRAVFLVLCRGADGPAFTAQDMETALLLGSVGVVALDASRLSESLHRAEEGLEATQRQTEELERIQREYRLRGEQGDSLAHRLELAWRAIAEAVDLRMGRRQGRARRAVELTLALGEPAGLPRALLVEAALLHDIGVVRALERDPSACSGSGPCEGEWSRRHPEDGAALLRQMDSSQETARAALHHHENFDGSGYPDGLAGVDIPFLARALRVVDSYLDLAHGYLDHLAISPGEALARVRDGSGLLFDPALVEQLAVALREEAGGEGRVREA